MPNCAPWLAAGGLRSANNIGYFSYYETYPMMTRARPIRHTSSPREHPSPLVAQRVTSTEAKNRFGQVFDAALEGAVVVITKHATPRAVLLSYDAYQALTRPSSGKLDELRSSFDEMLARMQSPVVQAGTRGGFRATPTQLGKAAVAAARRRD